LRGAGLKHAGLALGSLLVFAAAGELGLRALLPRHYYVWPPGFEWASEPDPRIGGIEGVSKLTINSFGMRGDEWTGRERYRVLAVGGSTTICGELDDSEAWPHLVQDRLEATLGENAVWVGNVGRPGHGTHQHILQVGKLLAQHPEIDAVLLLVGINDMLFHLGWTLVPPGARPPPDPDPDHHDSAGEPFTVTPARDPDAAWYQQLALARIFQLLGKEASASQSPIIDRSFSFVIDARLARSRAHAYRDELPDLEPVLAGYAKALAEIAQLIRSAGGRLILLTQPTLWRPDLSEADQASLWMGGPPFGIEPPQPVYYSIAALARGMQGFNQTLLRVCAEQGVECLDVAEKMPRDGSVFSDDAHLTERGARLLADQIAAYLAETKPLRP
jgi:lysophospholipase L1-like esterase